MSGAKTRDGRRRRLLQEESRSSSSDQGITNTAKDSGERAGRCRYAIEEGSLAKLLASRHFPSHALLAVGVGFAGLAAAGALVAMHVYRATIAASLGESLLPLFDLTGTSSLGRWMASASMLVVVFLAAMILNVRRRRVDDYRGRYRLWRGAVAMGLLLSIDAATNLHTVLAATVSQLTGVSLLSGGAEWWLAAGALLGGWVGVRVLLDIKESRLALSVYIASAIAYGAGLAAQFGWLPVAADIAATVAYGANLAGHVLAVTMLVAYTRFLRHDVEGGVASRPQKSRAAESKPAATKQRATKAVATKTTAKKQAEPVAETSSKRNNRGRLEKPAPATIQWTDGTDDDHESYGESYDDDSRPRKLSKSQRKKLRKQKAERRAA